MSDDRRWDERPKQAKSWRPEWLSRKAPGTPQSLEALFELMNKGNTGTGAFKFARGLFQYLSDDQLWAAYEMWCEGKFDSSVIEMREAWEKKKPL